MNGIDSGRVEDGKRIESTFAFNFLVDFFGNGTGRRKTILGLWLENLVELKELDESEKLDDPVELEEEESLELDESVELDKEESLELDDNDSVELEDDESLKLDEQVEL